MKLFLSIALAVVCVVLAVILFKTKQDDDARHDLDVSALTDCSNRLDAARSKIVSHEGTILTLSNNLAECQSSSSALSNHLAEAQTTIALNAEQITNLNRQVAEMTSENQASNQRILELTNQVAGLTAKIASTESSLAQANKDYSLLENRLRRDVAERVVAERKFYNLGALETQLEKLQNDPDLQISAESIYAGLGIEVRADGSFHVLSMD